jgi:hypothetical protein
MCDVCLRHNSVLLCLKTCTMGQRSARSSKQLSTGDPVWQPVQWLRRHVPCSMVAKTPKPCIPDSEAVINTLQLPGLHSRQRCFKLAGRCQVHAPLVPQPSSAAAAQSDRHRVQVQQAGTPFAGSVPFSTAVLLQEQHLVGERAAGSTHLHPNSSKPASRHRALPRRCMHDRATPIAPAVLLGHGRPVAPQLPLESKAAATPTACVQTLQYAPSSGGPA